MTDERSPLPLTAEERHLVLSLREIPESLIRGRVLTVVSELVKLAQEPCCNESQADGVPCASEKSLCETCARVFERARDVVDRTFPGRVALPVL